MTSDPSRIPGDEQLSEEDAHRVLARAVELDARDSSALSINQLREVAIEAGISVSALEQALAELKENTAAASVPQSRALSSSEASPQHLPLSQRLIRYRRYAAAVCFVVAATITPGDILTETILCAAPLYGAYELAIALVRRSERRKDHSRTSPPRATLPAREQLDRALPSHDDAPRSLRLRLA